MERMAKLRKRTLGQVIRERRRQLNLTQHEVAHRIKRRRPILGISKLINGIPRFL
jgi:transcriptional regulator with XRE-family HTH domain